MGSYLDYLKQLAPDPNHPVESFAALAGVGTAEIKKMLAAERSQAVLNSIIPKIEYLRIDAHNGHEVESSLIDLNRINDLNDQELKELVVRFTVLFSDALNPQIRARAIASTISNRCLMSRSHFAVHVLEAATTHDMTFDTGSQEAIEHLIEADTRLQSELQIVQNKNLVVPKRTVREADSQAVLGVQASDIAAGFATRRFEDVYEESTEAAAKHLREEFAHVMLNTRWL